MGAPLRAWSGNGEAVRGSSDDYDRQEMLEGVVEEYGPIIPENNAPKLYSTLRTEMVDRFNEAYNRLAPAKGHVGNVFHFSSQIYLVDSDIPNALYSAKVRGEHSLFVTTGLLDMLLLDGNGRLTEKSLNEGIGLLAGAFAHEYGHPLSTADRSKANRTWFGKASSSAIEFRADLEALRMLREAGFPLNSLHQVLERLEQFREKLSGNSILEKAESVFGSHPPDALRMLLLRLATTKIRFERGDHQLKPMTVPVGELRQELSRLNHLMLEAIPETNQSTPKDFREIVDELDAIFKKMTAAQLVDRSVPEYRVRQRMNHLIREADRYLSVHGSTIGEGDFNAFTKLLPFYLKFSENIDGANLIHISNPPSDRIPHGQYLAEVPFYRSERYRKWLRNSDEAREIRAMLKSGEKIGHYDRVKRYLVIVPSDVFVEEFADEISSYLREDFERLGSFTSLGIRLAFSNLLQERVIPHLSHKQRTELFLNWNKNTEINHLKNIFFKLSRSEDGTRLVHSWRHIKQPQFARDDQAMTRAAREIWKNRGEYATLDLVSRDHGMDWADIFDRLGIAAKQGFTELNQAVKQFTASPAYVELLKLFHADKKWRPMFKQKEFEFLRRKTRLWADRALLDHLSGAQNKTIVNKPELADLAKNIFVEGFLRAKPDLFRELYASNLRQALAIERKPLTVKRFLKLESKIIETILGKSVDVWNTPATVQDLRARTIAASRLAKAEKKNLLRELFSKNIAPLNSHTGESELEKSWIFEVDYQVKNRVMSALLEAGAFERPSDIFSLLEKSKTEAKSINDALREISPLHFRALKAFEVDLRRELGEIRNYKDMLSFAKTVLDPFAGQYKTSAISGLVTKKMRMTNSRNVQDFKKNVLRLAEEKLSLSFEQRLELFETLTATGATHDTDAYFRKNIESKVQTSSEYLSKLLENERIRDSKLKAKLAKTLVSEAIEAKADAKSIIAQIDRYLPGSSFQKDKIIEDALWRIDASSDVLIEHAETFKSSNWKNVDPSYANVVSSLEEALASMEKSEKIELLDYILDPAGKEMPVSVSKGIDRAAGNAANLFEKGSKSLGGKIASDEVKGELSAAIDDVAFYSSADEKTAIVDMIIHAGGSQSLYRDPTFPKNIASRFLPFSSESSKGLAFDAYLSIVSPEESSVSLAYLMTHSADADEGLVPLFQLFRSVGIKGGQLGALWKVFGAEESTRLEKLKDNAEPMTIKKIREVMKANMTAEQFERIKLKKVIGSASMKTVVLVEIDGQEAVMAVLDPDAYAQIESNMARARAYVEALGKRGLKSQSGLVGSLLDSVEQQLKLELKMTREAAEIERAAAFYDKMNIELAQDLDGWKFKVPRVVKKFHVPTDQVMFLELAQGVSFERLSPDIKRKTGGPIAESTLQGLFRYGWFNADSHGGNFLVDEKTKTIAPIDFGQVETFVKRSGPLNVDETYLLSRFFGAIGLGDARGTVAFAARISENKKVSKKQLELLVAKVAQIFRDNLSKSDRIIALVEVLSANGLKLPKKYEFGALKGLMVLEKQQYVSSDDFNRMIGREVAGQVARKAPLAIADEAGCRLPMVTATLRTLFQNIAGKVRRP